MFARTVRLPLIAVILASLVGCGSKYQYPEAKRVEPAEEVQKIVKLLNTKNPMSHKMAVNRLGELGSVAQPAIPELQKFAKRYPNMKQEVDASIAKIQSGGSPK